jgi:hypothetical protein
MPRYSKFSAKTPKKNSNLIRENAHIVSKEIKAEIGELIFLSYFLAKRVKSQRGRN